MTKIYYDYEICSTGKIYSISTNWRGYGKREMLPSVNKDGYKFCRLVINGSRKKVYLHKIVCILFNGERPSLNHQIRHLDGDKLNNNYSNLKWGTAKENADDREFHKKYKLLNRIDNV